ncbi:hypothetical protein OIU84_027581 [Salix udensis]|uniref:Uncharacterized protein n=1 Tax=Salix udensis TaxID=889485 RepID=A0AAD6KH88_9ROSI|nr:hypothetical protein OIU84_027581 [Salix udensis]
MLQRAVLCWNLVYNTKNILLSVVLVVLHFDSTTLSGSDILLLVPLTKMISEDFFCDNFCFISFRIA